MREAVQFTAAETAFPARLIEKDYFCTVLLEHLAAECTALVFKGGTCLAKVHAEFYRLSEDLDFVIPMPSDAPRAERSKKATVLKSVINALPRSLPFFRLTQPLTGANKSMPYNAEVSFESLSGRWNDSIKIEVGLREPLAMPIFSGAAQTILLDPVTGERLIKPITLRCISRAEAFAEKFRAALSRREVAIRDFYDIDYAVQRQGLLSDDVALVKLVRGKLAVPDNDPVDVSERRRTTLQLQLVSQLKPVLRAENFAEFDLDRAFKIVAEMAERLLLVPSRL